MRQLSLLISLSIVSLFAGSALAAETPDTSNTQDDASGEFKVNLQDPVFKQGVVSTDKGGVISGDGLRIQAQKITYINQVENGIHRHAITAEGDLLLQYGDQAFVGKRLEYDLVSRTGTLYEGKTYVDIWYLGGDKILLQNDGSYYIYGGYITTSESQDALWELHANSIRISDEKTLSARDVRLNFVQLPFFWLPSLRANLKRFKDSPIRYKVTWDKGLGPRISARYRLYSWEDLSIYLRGDYRIAHGGGGAFETEYETEDRRTEFVTRSYGAINDRSVPIQHRPNHYRLQGLYRTESVNEKTKVLLTYDKISDEKMIGEFHSDDFEINTQKRTRLFIDHKEPRSFVNFRLQPRINWWQSLNQELPSVTVGIKPFTFGDHSGIIMQNWVNAAYLDYVYATDLKRFIPNTHSARLQAVSQVYRPIPLRYFTVTPDLGFITILYNNNPFGHSAYQLVGTYGGLLDTHLTKQGKHFTHQLRPYASFRGITKPTSSIPNHYIFGIEDGLTEINLLRVGVENTLYSRKNHSPFPTLYTDLYTYGFFGQRGDLRTIPRLYADLDLEQPTRRAHLGISWNIQERLVDYINMQLAWTVNQNFAFLIEMRHRSRFAWRKADYDNFILDVARPINQLLHSPLSDGRNTLLGQVQLRLHPLWTCHLSTHTGWGRRHEPAYHSEKIDLFTMIATSWRLRISAMFSPEDVRFDWGIHLVE